MTKNSRTFNALRNISVSVFFQAFTLLLNFTSRTLFIRLLGNDYLSCDGLFTNILTLLSFSELGIGSAILFSLYKPVAENDRVQIGKLINLFATAYRFIALAITVLGLCIIPLLKYLITDVPTVKENITLLYVLFLANTVSTYIFGYKRSLLTANQENYIVVSVHHGTNMLRIALQILLLLLTHNYILYLSIGIATTLANNIIVTLITNKKYPWINKYKKTKLSKDEQKPIFSNIAAIFQYKIGSVILNGTDNIIISLVLKTSLVGLVSNYNMIILAIQGIFNQAADALQPTVGNLNVSVNNEKRYDVFNKLYFISFWIVGFLSIGISTLSSNFIEDVWLDKDYVLSNDVVISLCLSFFILLINTIPSMFRTTLGYFKQARLCPVYASVLNIVLSIILAKVIGLSGIFFATAISRFFTFNIIDPYLVFKNSFNKPLSVYFKKFGVYLILLLANFFFTSLCIKLIPFSGIIGFVIKFIVCCVACNGFFLLVFFKTQVFADVLLALKNMIKGRGKK